MKKLQLATSVAVLSAAFAAPSFAADVTLKFGHVGKPGSLFEASVNAYAQCVNDESNGKIEVQTFGSSQLGKDKELLQKLKLGQVDFALPSSVMSSVSDEFGVFEMPYIIKDREHMKRVQEKLGGTFQAAAQAKGYHIVGYFENGFRHITNNTRPVNVPADLEGVKLRTPKGAWRVKMFKLYGANPTPMAFSDVFTALKTGVIDGQENPMRRSHLRNSKKYKSTYRLPDTFTLLHTSCRLKSTSKSNQLMCVRFSTVVLRRHKPSCTAKQQRLKQSFWM